MKSWRELLATPLPECERRSILAPLGQDRSPCVLMPPYGFRADPELLVAEILGHIDPDLLEDRLYVEPTQEQVDEWLMAGAEVDE